MKLADLNPRWFAEEGRHGQGVIFQCPCGCKGTERAVNLAVVFTPPLDGGAVLPVGKISVQYDAVRRSVGEAEWNSYRDWAPSGIAWQRSGDTFETLTLAPSVDYGGAGHWHGHVQGGEIR